MNMRVGYSAFQTIHHQVITEQLMRNFKPSGGRLYTISHVTAVNNLAISCMSTSRICLWIKQVALS